MTKMNNWEKELSNLLTKMSEHYLIDDEFEKELKWFITNALNQQRELCEEASWNMCSEIEKKFSEWEKTEGFPPVGMTDVIKARNHAFGEFLTKLEK